MEKAPAWDRRLERDDFRARAGKGTGAVTAASGRRTLHRFPGSWLHPCHPLPEIQDAV
jgi:hypothetical protein